MNDCKNICDLEWCKKHSSCIFKNAESSLKVSSYEVKTGQEINANVILCYQKQGIGLEVKREPKPELVKVKQLYKVKRSVKKTQPVLRTLSVIESFKKELCENPKCKSGNPESVVRHNNDINLCKSCNDLIHYHQSNHELARYFNSKTKIIKLLGCIRELEKETNDKPKKVIRCSNIYCGTTLEITIHHLIPKAHRAGILGKIPRMYLCDPCHKRVHKLKSPMELANEYNTKQKVVELLAGDREFSIPRFFLNESTPVMAVG